MAHIILNHAGVEFQIHNSNTRSLKNRIINTATGGKITAGLNGRTVVKALSDINFESNKPVLSVRELEVVERLARGWSANQIAEDLYLSTATIKSHVASLYRKLECSNKTSAVTKANSLGLIKI